MLLVGIWTLFFSTSCIAPAALRELCKKSTIYLFSRLPNADQEALLRSASPDERKRYFPRAHMAVKQKFYREAGAAVSQ